MGVNDNRLTSLDFGSLVVAPGAPPRAESSGRDTYCFAIVADADLSWAVVRLYFNERHLFNSKSRSTRIAPRTSVVAEIRESLAAMLATWLFLVAVIAHEAVIAGTRAVVYVVALWARIARIHQCATVWTWIGHFFLTLNLCFFAPSTSIVTDLSASI